MTLHHGFTFERIQQIPEINTTARIYRHARTGAELLSLENKDENKVFAITFRTPPTDSTGVAHILEHAVLAGSRRYPSKEPFKELAGGSLKTFLNAFTYPDRTVYPVASQNLQDFYHLIEVYLDAVFYPLLTPYTFGQEGWHYEPEADGALSYRGVVFNEMKGAYASPDDALGQAVQTALFVGHTYGIDSGGDPQHIPDLTYEQLLAFHRAYYHPSNARIWFYGDDPTEERLRRLDEWLSAFDQQPVDSHVPTAHFPPQPQLIEQPYVASPEEERRYVTVNWGLIETPDAETALALGVLTQILIGSPSSPLRKALIDSGLGEDLAGTGLTDELRHLFFSTGLKGVAAEDVGAVETLILDTLQSLADGGIDPLTVAAAMNTAEFQLREMNTGGFPRGLALLLRSLTTWLYEGDPLAPLAFAQPLARLQARLAADPRLFESLLRRFFLANNARVTLVLAPDPDLQERWDAAEAARLAEARARMTESDLAGVIAFAEELHRIHDTPDTPEALAAIPRLALSDLDRQSKILPIAVSEHAGSQVLYHDLFTNGITYLDVGLDLRVLPAEYLPYLGFFGRVLLEMGAGSEDFVALDQRIGSQTGGISAAPFTSIRRQDGEPTAWLFIRGKAMVDRSAELFAILRHVLLTPWLNNQERFGQIVLEEKAMQEAELLPAGHAVVSGRLRSHFNPADAAAEQMGGLSYLFFLRKLAVEVEQDWPAVQARLEAIHALLIQRSAMLWNVTVDAESWQQIQPALHELIEAMPAGGEDGAVIQPAAWAFAPAPHHEAFTLPAQVNYVGKGANLFALGYSLDGSAHVIANYLRTAWLWEQVRMRGGAYGGFCTFDQRSGVFAFLSYRDPHLSETLRVYDETAVFLRNLNLSDDELTKAIIGVIGAIDAYMLPDAKGFVSMQRYLLGETDALRQQLREEILSANAADFSAFAEVLERMNAAGHTVVLGGRTAVAAANQDGRMQVVEVL